ncbi:fused MFS/spermidine synthase, partial [Candidatus Peregrinibacteria bacterium]|nr:fused MFS/spermidine synthase [Candidatus Peregrinibacteria bacterium]
GAVVMVLELTGARVLAPTLGNSLFVWTSIIGIILGSLSLGYFLGGKVADKEASFEKFSNLLLSAAVLIGIMATSKNFFLDWINSNVSSIRLGSVLASILLFAPASIFLGMVSPYAVRLKIKNINSSGRTVGNLYALSTIGSIFGTFFAGFYLISVLANTEILFTLAITMVITSLIAFPKKLYIKIVILVLLSAYLWSIFADKKSFAEAGQIEINTPYNTVLIVDELYNNKPARMLKISTNHSSAMYLNSNELVFRYTKFYDLARHFMPKMQSALILGGGAYSYPKHFLKAYPQASIDVVEIDPELTEIAKKYFKLYDDDRLNIYHEDGRTFLNRTENKYDVFFGDAFKSFYSLPYQLTTQEAVQKTYDVLNPEGVAIVNIIASIEGDTGQFLRAELKTFKSVFPQVYIFPVWTKDPNTIQNITLVALKSEQKPSFENPDFEIQSYLNTLYTEEIPDDMPIITDEFAPVDQYIMKLLDQ